ncbi:MAG: aspartate--tRNA(Asn) ligase, partial [Candidatus Aenigmatarchaeota archaeon]
VKGTVKANKEAPHGFEIIPREARILNMAEAPLPMEVVTKKTPAELPTRLDARFIDLRKPEVATIFNIADTLKISFLNYFDSKGFININPPIIIGAASEGGAELFPVKYFDREAYLNQSPQLYKQILMAAGFDKVSIVTPVFRAEPHDTPRHLNEAIQMDIEVAFVRDEEDALKWYDEVIPHMIEQVKKKCGNALKILEFDLPVPKKPLKRITYDEALEILKKKGIKLKWGEDFTPEAEKRICQEFNPVIITKWPTALRSFYSMPEPGNPKICRAYDVLYNGIEISSGAQRIHIYKDLMEAFKRKGLSTKGFEFYLDSFRFGAPPHGGWSIGLERLTMALLKLSTIREATLFPRTKERLTP